ncbi:hypothetical protein BABINDRAFT_27950, partial [Babjeviella inositovora NRRL Y-12698]
VEIDSEHSSDIEIINETNTYLSENATNRNSTDKRFNESVCPICFDSFDQAVISSCGHLFCADCLFQSLDNSSQGRADRGACPLCRKLIAYKDIQYLRFKV